MKRRLLGASALLMFAASTVSIPPAHALGCNPICALAGVVDGSNLYPDPFGAFALPLTFNGVLARNNSAQQVTRSATLYGTMSETGASTGTGVGTLVVFDNVPGAKLAAVPVRITVASRGGASSFSFEPLSRAAVAAGHSASLVLIDGELDGTLQVARLLNDSGTGMSTTISTPGYFLQGAATRISGMVRSTTGQGLSGVPVDLIHDEQVVASTRTDSTGSWSIERTFFGTATQRLRAVALRESLAPSESPEVSLPAAHEISVNILGNGRVVGPGIDCPGDCNAYAIHGTNVQMQATPATFYAFSNWSGNCTGTSTTCSLSMLGSRTVTAHFGPNNWNLLESEPNGTLATADPVAPPLTIGGSLPQGDVDIYSFSLPAHTILTAQTFDKSASGCTGLDTVLTLLDANGAQLATNDDHSGTLCSRIVRELHPGNYHLKVTPYGTSSATEYRLRLQTPLALEPNDTIDTATPITMQSFTRTSIFPVGDVDMFRFTLQGPSSVLLETYDASPGSCSGIDTVIYLYDSYGVQLDWDDDDGIGFCSYLGAGLPAGTFYVKVIDFQSNHVIPSYTLALTEHA